MRLGNSLAIPLTCEFRLGDALYKGPILELHPDGFFVATDAEAERSAVLEIRLESQATGQVVVAEAVVERRVSPSARSPQQQRGLQLRIFHLTPEYNLLVGARSQDVPASDALHDDRVGDRRGGGSDVVSADGNAELLQPETPLRDRAGVPVFDVDSHAPRAAVIDDGELTEIVAMLRSLDATTQRSTPSVSGTLDGWIAPTHLLVITAKRALALGHALDLAHAEFTALVVTDSDARTLHPIVHRLGYRFVVRRPVHPEALRTLLRQTLHRDSGRRSTPRVASGCEVHWKLSGTLRRHSGTLVDLSPGSCQLLVRDAVTIGSRVRIRIPASVSGGRRIDLCGRVVRRSMAPAEQRALGVVFDEIPQRMCDRLDALIEKLASGPTRLERPGGELVSESLPLEDVVIPAPSQPTAPAVAPQPERRRNKRAVFERQLVALDAESEAVRFSLIARDLSVEGMRVEPNPGLRIDDHVRLAFYDSDDAEPMILHAVVTRIDGLLGSCLRFIGVDSDTRSRIAHAVDELPSIEAVDADEPEAAWAAIGQVELVPKPVD